MGLFSPLINRLNKKKEHIDKDIIPLIEMMRNECEALFISDKYLNYNSISNWLNESQKIIKKVGFLQTWADFAISENSKPIIKAFREELKNFGQSLINRNDLFVKQKLKEHKIFFDKIENKSLNNSQREAVIRDEDNNIIHAGAGTGKTLTITAKVAYLVNICKVDPKKILLLAFTKKAVDEMKTRILKIVDTAPSIHTFHSFGLRILGEVEGDKPSMAFESDITRRRIITIKNIFNSLLNKDEEFLLNVVKYFLFYYRMTKPAIQFDSKDEYDTYCKEIELLTLNKEVVKSYEELLIANFLFLNQIEYKYEMDYEHKVSTPEFRQYQPDFYLPNYGIYIEHFGIDKKGNVPTWFKSIGDRSAKQTYNEGIKVKRDWHKEYGTTLVETYSYYETQGILLEKLESKLKPFDVKFEIRPKDELLTIVNEYLIEAQSNRFIELISTFLSLFKSNQFNFDQIREKAKKADSVKRSMAFIDIFNDIYDKYENSLKKIEKIDFDDMIARATEYVRAGKWEFNYDYILVDEFQDISVGRYKFLKAILKRNNNQKVFAVGDDWQSIYRFTGSDVTLMYNFEKDMKIIGNYKRETFSSNLDVTYRFNNEIAELSKELIIKNEKQKNKTIKSNKPDGNFPLDIKYVLNKESQPDQLKKILNDINNISFDGNDIDVLLLGRYNHDQLKSDIMKNLKSIYKNCNIEFSTIHSAKGTEADYVIILNVNKDKIYGFPTAMGDDPLIDLLLTSPEQYPFAEERRLFYVALTRAREKIYLTTWWHNDYRSDFIKELEYMLDIRKNCYCGKELVLRFTKKDEPYFSCFNSQCRHTTNIDNEKYFNQIQYRFNYID